MATTELRPMASVEAPCVVILLGDGAFFHNKPRELRYLKGGMTSVQEAHFVLDAVTGYVHKHRWKALPEPVITKRRGEYDGDDLEAVARLRAALAKVYHGVSGATWFNTEDFNTRLAEAEHESEL